MIRGERRLSSPDDNSFRDGVCEDIIEPPFQNGK